MKIAVGVTVLRLVTKNIIFYEWSRPRSPLFRNMATIIDGKAIAAEIRSGLRKDVSEFIAAGNRAPSLVAVLVGDNPASQSYVRNKMTAAKEIGIESTTKLLPSETTEQELLNLIEKLNGEDTVDGILVQLPLPEHMNERKICNAVAWEKDVDGFNEVNIGRLCLDTKSIAPCTPLGIKELLKRYKVETFGKNVVVVGRSKIVGMPVAMMLHTDGRHETEGMDGTVTICHRFTPPEELKRHCKQADIIVVAVGKPKLITADMVKEGACVIDVGINRIPGTGDKVKFVGDVDFEEVRKIAGYITPVPGGVGPMTVAMLMRNTVDAAKGRAKAVRQMNQPSSG